ncbi:MAG TPA: prenyltransferase [Dehalococcoidales bacterium]|nr:prenyltransferase [Dehalococcoidales bacterium]
MGQTLSTKRFLLSWLTLFRLGATARGVLPFLLGAVIAWSQGNPINLAVLVLSSIAVIFVMLMTFLINEYNDYEADVMNKEFHRLSGGSRVLPMGLIPRQQSLIAAYVCLSLAVIIGLWLYFYYQTGPFTIPLGTVAIFIGYFYTARPFRWSYCGLGEIAIWFSCGWLATFTGYYLQTGHFDMVTTLAALPGATSVFLLILINEIPDINSDRKAGKRNLAVRLGREKAGILYSIALILCYLNIVVIIFFGVPLITAFLSLILVPLIIWNIVTIRKHGLRDVKIQEGLSLRTMLIDHLITIIYTIGFIVAGLSLITIRIDYLVVLAIAYVFVFGLEGLGLFSSKMVTQQ